MLNIPYQTSLSPETLQQDAQYSAFSPQAHQMYGSSMQPGTNPYTLMLSRNRSRGMVGYNKMNAHNTMLDQISALLKNPQGGTNGR